MKIAHKIENFIAKRFEGFFAKKFPVKLQPVEIAKSIDHEVENKKIIGITHVYIPNNFKIYVSKADYDDMQPHMQLIIAELSNYLITKAKDTGYTLTSDIEIVFLLEKELELGCFKTISDFSQPIDESLDKEFDEPDTLVFKKVNDEPNQTPHDKCTAIIRVIEGLDQGKQLEINHKRVNLGRRETNEFSLSDFNSSRLHAYIVYENGEHVIYDAKSLNGTYVNNGRVVRKRLNNLDKIKIGNTLILYEVKSCLLK